MTDKKITMLCECCNKTHNRRIDYIACAKRYKEIKSEIKVHIINIEREEFNNEAGYLKNFSQWQDLKEKIKILLT